MLSLSTTKQKVAAGVAGVLVAAGIATGAVAVNAALSGNCTTDLSAAATVRTMVDAPTAANTGPTNRAAITKASGDITVSCCGTTIENTTVNGGITITAKRGDRDLTRPCVTIRNSVVHGVINNGYGSSCAGGPCGPTLIEDVDLDYNNGTGPNLLYTNYVALRVNERGGRTGMMIEGGEIHDSFIHDNWFVNGAHMGGILSNGNYGIPMVIDHNTVLCNIAPGSPGGSSGGCSADLNFYGDNSAITLATVTDNYLRANPGTFYYCAYTGASQSGKPHGTGTNIVWRGNVFERGGAKCGGAGPVADWAANAGNAWCGNVWDTRDAAGSVTAGLPASTSNCGVTPPTTTTTVAPTTTSTASTSTTTIAPTTTRPATSTTSAPTTSSTSTVPPSTTTTTEPPRTVADFCKKYPQACAARG